MKKYLSVLYALCLYSNNLFADTAIPIAASANNYQLQLITSDITIPWGMVWLNNNELLVTDRAGQLRMIRNAKLLKQPIAGVPKVYARGQGGLLDIERDPNYTENGWLYLSYAAEGKNAQGNNTAIMRAKLKDMQLEDKELLFHGQPQSKGSRHYGSRIEFDNNGYLYFTLGDRGNRAEFPQQLNNDAGKVHRLNADGSVPSSNPFVNQANARASIYSYGHRNPQGMAKHPVTGDIWIHEHGPRGGDEINIIQAGSNYGWPIVTYGINYNGTIISTETAREGMVQPNWVWTPSIAPSAMQFVIGNTYPEWQGHLLIGSLKFAHLVLMQLDGNNIKSQQKLFAEAGRVRSISQHPNGDLYLGIDGKGIVKIVPTH